MTLLLYLTKSFVLFSVLYLLYLLLFRRYKNFSYNRVYLLGTMVCSVLFPLFQFSPTVEAPHLSSYTIYVPAGLVADFVPVQSSSQSYLSGSLFSVFLFIYLVVASLFLMRFLVGLWQIRKLLSSCTLRVVDGVEVLFTSKQCSPFCFGKYIVLPIECLSHKDLSLVVCHEQTHCSKWHCIDIWCSELFQIFQWCNPFVWFFKKDLVFNLECQADFYVSSQFDEIRYQMAMVRIAQNKRVAPFVAALNHSQLKNRILMMNKINKEPFALAKRILLVPVAIVLFLSINHCTVSEEGAAESELVTTKSQEMLPESAALQLRKAIARAIKYPVIAIKQGNGMTITGFVLIAESGALSFTEEAPSDEFVQADEVVAVGFKAKTELPDGTPTLKLSEEEERTILVEGCKRCFSSITGFETSELRGKVLKMDIRFVQQ